VTVSTFTLEAHNIRKAYGGIVALRGVDLQIQPGAVHGLLGENGAGKSTFIKILAGVTNPDAGYILLDGRETRITNTADAARQGIAVVSQELNLFPDLDVLANLFPLREPRIGPFIQRKRMRELAEPVLDELGLTLDPDAPVGGFSLEHRQLIEIARALLTNPRVLILDEPTSALHVHQTQRLHDVLRALRQRKVAVVYVSHILEDVLEMCDVVTVLRDGLRVVDAAPTSSISIDELVRAMLGSKVLPQSTPAAASVSAGATARALRFENVSVPERLSNVTFAAEAGKIIGVAGLSGSGHLDTLAVAAGLLRPSAGVVRLPDGRPLKRGRAGAIQQGVGLVPGDRRRVGLMLDKPIWENISQVRSVALTRDGAFFGTARLRERARGYIIQLGIKASSEHQSVGELSGGNQQKVVFAKWLDAQPSVLLLDDPTRGIDVGAKAEIYALMRQLAGQGIVQLFASTDPLELAAVCDRVVVFFNGRLCAMLTAPNLSAQTILEVMNTGSVMT
jgi:ABC-type sugar transport system ATPase subunit